METSRLYKGFLLVILAAVLFGTTGTSQALAPAGISSTTIGSLRLIIGGPALLMMALIFGNVRLSTFRPPFFPPWLPPPAS